MKNTINANLFFLLKPYVCVCVCVRKWKFKIVRLKKIIKNTLKYVKIHVYFDLQTESWYNLGQNVYFPYGLSKSIICTK